MKHLSFSVRISLVLIAVLLSRYAEAQPFPASIKGQAVATCFSGYVPPNYNQIKDDYVVGIIDVHVPVGGGNWPAPMYHGDANSWKSSKFGQVYGIAIDKRNNIFITASSSYGNFAADPLGFGATGGSGGIYRLNSATGVGAAFVTTASYTQTPAASVGTTTLPNGNGTNVKPGLGNITYDAVHDKLFVTNHEDGVIYRINAISGVVEGFYDPTVPANPLGTTNPAMVADNQTLGFAPLGERIWGIGYNPVDNRIYYSVWMEDLSNGTATTSNIIRSIGLTATGAFNAASDDRAEIKMPDFPSTIRSSPVADIEFSSAGKMFVGECSMGGPMSRSAHSSRAFQYTGVSLAWGTPMQVYVGAGATQTNSSGGVDYGYGGWDKQKRENLFCDSVFWMSGDYLAFFGGFSAVYGLQMTPNSGNTNANVQATGYFIDLNGVPGTQDKTQIGDVDIFRDSCGSKLVAGNVCDSVRVTAKSMADGTPGAHCCYKVTLTNGVANFWTNVTAQAISPGFTFASAAVPAGWSLTNSGTLVNWMPPGTYIPTGVTDSLILCITSTTAPPQLVEITWHGANGVKCRDTLVFDCPTEKPPIPPCAVVKNDTLKCTQSSSGGYVYQYCFTVTNNSVFSQAPYFYPAEHVVVTSGTPGVNVVPGSFSFAPLPYGGTTGQLCVTLSGPGVVPGASICVVLQLHGQHVGNFDKWCCPPDTVCFRLPPCKDCCEGFKKDFKGSALTTNGSGVSTITTSITAGPAPIIKFTATIVSADIKRFGNANFCKSTGWLPVAGDIINPAPWFSAPGQLPLFNTPQPFSSAPPAPYREAIWGTNPSGVVMTSYPLALQMQFPAPPPPFNGCYDSLRFCIRLTFTDKDCRTCDTLICRQIKRVGSWIHDINDPIKATTLGSIKMTSKTNGTLTVNLPKLPPELTSEDGIRIVGLSMEAGSGVRLTSFDGVPARDYVGKKTVTIAHGETVSVPLVYDNYSDQRTFSNFLTYTYVQVNNAARTFEFTEEIIAVVPGKDGAQGDIFAKDDSSAKPTNVRTYALYFANRNTAGIAAASATLSVGKGSRILATGPFEDSASVSYSAMNGFIDRKPHLFPIGTTWFVDGPECKIIHGSVIRPIYLTVAGDIGKSVVVRYQTKDERGNLLSEDSVTLSDPLTIVRKDDPPSMRATGYLYPVYPNPAATSSSVQLHLDAGEKVTLGIYDALGNEVVQIFSDLLLSSGDHVFTLTTGDLPSGMYNVVMRIGNSQQTQKLQIVR